MRGFIPPQNSEEQIFCKRIIEIAKKVQYADSLTFTLFLDERQQQLAQAQLNKYSDVKSQLWGGYINATRLILCVYSTSLPLPDFSVYPLSAVNITCNGAQGLSHRDYLGAVLALNIKRECVGDIVVHSQNSATVFIADKFLPIIKTELISVGKYNATVVETQILENINNSIESEMQKNISVASLRLDAVLAAMLNQSRNNACKIISGGLVWVNHITVDSLHYELQQNDKISIRGYGMFEILNIGGLSRKNRIFITFIKY